MPAESILSDQTVRVDAIEVPHELSIEALPKQSPVDRALWCLIIFGVIVMPVWFGGVHQTLALGSQAAVFLGLAFLLPGQLRSLWERSSATQLIGSTLGLVAGYALIQALCLSLTAAPHPVLGTSALLPSISAFASAWRSLLFFLGSFLLVRCWIGFSASRANQLRNLLWISALLVCGIALSHWFYDNGKLFWFFEPDYIFLSTRARSPFVNSDHLAHFLLPLSAILLGSTVFETMALSEPYNNAGKIR